MFVARVFNCPSQLEPVLPAVIGEGSFIHSVLHVLSFDQLARSHDLEVELIGDPRVL